MSMKYTLAIIGLSMTVLAGQARAESEGNGDPFPFRAYSQAYNVGQPSVETAEVPLGRQTASLAMSVRGTQTTNPTAAASRPSLILASHNTNIVSK